MEKRKILQNEFCKLLCTTPKNSQRKTDADNYHYFSHDDQAGVKGIAGVGTVCRTSRRSRTAISEWIGSADSHYAENQCMLVGNKYVSIDVMPL